jgi:hypothetical protein
MQLLALLVVAFGCAGPDIPKPPHPIAQALVASYLERYDRLERIGERACGGEVVHPRDLELGPLDRRFLAWEAHVRFTSGPVDQPRTCEGELTLQFLDQPCPSGTHFTRGSRMPGHEGWCLQMIYLEE